MACRDIRTTASGPSHPQCEDSSDKLVMSVIRSRSVDVDSLPKEPLEQCEILQLTHKRSLTEVFLNLKAILKIYIRLTQESEVEINVSMLSDFDESC